jgi:flagellar operon protein
MDIRHLTGRVDPVSPQKQKPTQQPDSEQAKRTQQGETFKEVLQRKSVDETPAAERLQFSGHAQQRLIDRNIQLNQVDMQRIEEAVDRAQAKGSKESLILDGDNAFIVNVENRTVITAVDQLEMREKVFTQIDSTVLTQPQQSNGVNTNR